MPSSNFAIAVITVVLRGLLDRLFAAVQPPLVKPPAIPSSTSVVLISGTLLLLYNRLIKGRGVPASHPSVNRRKILDGRLHKKDSRSSSASQIREHAWSPRRFRRRSRSRNNLLQAPKDSLQMLHGDVSSSSLYTKSGCSVKCHCKDSSVARTELQEGSPSVYSIKSEGDGVEKTEEKVDNVSNEYRGFGDCQWQEHPKMPRRRKRMRTTRKTRSGKIYSSL